MEHLVLLIDDDEDESLLLELALRYCGYPTRVHQVTEFDKAVAFIDTHSERPSLVFLDLRMPIDNGWDILRWIRTHPHINEVPVVVWSHTDNQTDIDDSYQQGANFFLSKTANKEAMRDTMTEICTRWLN